MKVRKSARTTLFAWVFAAGAVVSCFAEPTLVDEPPAADSGRGGRGGGRGGSTVAGGPPAPSDGGEGNQSEGGNAGTAGNVPLGKCNPVEGSEDLPARAIVSSEDLPTDAPYFTANLFALFTSTCGGCHVSSGAGGFKVGLSNFSSVVTADVLAMIKGETDPIMPPLSTTGGKEFSDRSPDDPIVRLATQLRIWLDQGSPQDVFMLPAEAGGQSFYHMAPELAAKLTNLGTCVPEPKLVGFEKSRMEQLDEFFASLEPGPEGSTLAERIGLPVRLDSTDLISMDSEVLAKNGVIAFSPLYPLWSDGSGKLRYVRVPIGESIRFDPETREFEIPDNTRFYKTFLKRTIQADGTIGYRKVETRLIVARRDRALTDGTFEPRALFGTYVWNEAETEATLLTNPLRNGEPFADLVNVLVRDEPGAQAIRDKNPRNLAYAMEDAGVLRRYGIPGSARCIECHMGSQSQSFVLGFTPMQIARRPIGEGGVIENSSADELTQLERLIDYGLITNMEPEDAPKLEESQLPRRPRTNQELVAQGYMFGNCGHCHNPRGFPSVSNPALKPLLDFWPSEGGGIFEFPLDRVSPRIKRGASQDVDLPYITPSLRDLYPTTYLIDAASTGWRPKVEPATADKPAGFIDAPWRSVIYRNVDTPFTYSDGYAIFPHMPRHTAGFDCRAPQIIGDWMVSIPAKIIDPFKYQDAVPCDPAASTCLADFSSQPYREVKAGADGYDKAVEEAKARLALYHQSSRYTTYCPEGLDIMDRGVLEGDRVVPEDQTVISQPWDGVPDRPHFPSFDLTEVSGPWLPRRSDWVQYVAKKEMDPPPEGLEGSGLDLFLQDRAAKLQVLDAVQGITLSAIPEFETRALAEVPFGLWEPKEECDFSSQQTIEEIREEGLVPRWVSRFNGSQDAPVYKQTPAAAVYGMICINCHGQNADSKGRQAATLSDMTGGAARVANLRDGLFGLSGANIDRAFGAEAELPETAPDNWLGTAWPGGEPEDWAARYLAWMALGGTQQQIPKAVTNLVLNTEVLGTARPRYGGKIEVSANMLAVAQLYCSWFLPMQQTELVVRGDSNTELVFHYDALLDHSGLIQENGDAELWEWLCNYNNPGPVRVLLMTADTWTSSPTEIISDPSLFYARDAYPAGAPIGDQEGNVTSGIGEDNIFPWCVRAKDAADREQALLQTVNGQPLPVCPDEMFVESKRWLGNVEGARPPAGVYTDDHRSWSARGAINAGLAVFLYMRGVADGSITPRPNHNECELLSAD